MINLIFGKVVCTHIQIMKTERILYINILLYFPMVKLDCSCKNSERKIKKKLGQVVIKMQIVFKQIEYFISYNQLFKGIT